MDHDDHTAAHALASQVGGHAGVMTTEDGSLIIKPVLHRELEFYQTLQQDPALVELRPFTPKFLGTLKLEGTVDPAQTDLAQGVIVEPIEDQKDTYLLRGCSFCATKSMVLENLSFAFLKPNIMDVKLGTVLYDETASPEKVERMLKVASITTSLETGIRLTGFQVHDNVTSQPVNTPKTYGKSIKASELGEGIRKFFPVGIPTASDGSIPSSGLPLDTLVPVLRGIREEIAYIREAYASLEIRMVGGSLLIVYEADWERAAEAIKKYEEEEDEEEDEDEEDDEEDDDDETKKSGPPFAVKLIDFAHTSLAPGQGPDENVLLGMDTVLKLLDERLSELS